MPPTPPGAERLQRVQALFKAALSMDAAARAAYLAEQCPDDPAMQAEVEAMIVAVTPARSQVLPQLGSGDFSSPRSTQAIHPTPTINPTPARIHNYEVVSKIGEGGMGAVYLARHHFFERSAALKVLHPHLCADSTLVQRFLNEARAANTIRHPNIIEVIDTGLMPDSGTPYLLMEYLEGENLGARLSREGRLSPEEALQIAGQVTSALAAAHDKGIVHRDLKPENLFLVPRPDGGTPTVKVLDFGIAKLRAEATGKQIQTLPGSVVGTPRYMSPEQCLGAANVDSRSDIYSLGVILFEMVCGETPFNAEGFGGLIAAHIMQEPPRPRSLNPDLPAEIEAAILQALAKDPNERFQNMREFRAALGPDAVPRALPSAGTTTYDGAPTTRSREVPAVVVAPSATMKRTDLSRSTFSSSATELGAVKPRPKGRLLFLATLAAVTVAATVFFLKQQRAREAAPAATATVAGPPAQTPPAVTAPVTPPPPPVEAIAQDKAETPPRPAPEPTAPTEQPKPAVAADAAAAPAPPKPAGVTTPRPTPVTPPTAGKKRSKPAATTPAKPKEFEPPLW
jgi:eukaryotic-like serine/threonine-protein kinase